MMDAAEFNRRMAELPEPPNGEPPYWEHWRHQLWELGQTMDPASFMAWPAVYHTMLVNHWDMSGRLEQLRATVERRWLDAIEAPSVGIPMDYHPGTSYSKNMIEQAMHVLHFEQVTGKAVDRLLRIFEFGGGFGAMALLMHRLGFSGSYRIYDLPEFSLLQRWFLDATETPRTISNSGEDALWPCDLLIAIYSLSEMEPRDRLAVLDRHPADYYLFVYSAEWQDWDNRAWFEDYAKTHDRLQWLWFQMADRPDWYMIGWPK